MEIPEMFAKQKSGKSRKRVPGKQTPKKPGNLIPDQQRRRIPGVREIPGLHLCDPFLCNLRLHNGAMMSLAIPDDPRNPKSGYKNDFSIDGSVPRIPGFGPNMTVLDKIFILFNKIKEGFYLLEKNLGEALKRAFKIIDQ